MILGKIEQMILNLNICYFMLIVTPAKICKNFNDCVCECI